MENIKRAESSLVVRGANMIITLYLRSISAVSSLWLLGCTVDITIVVALVALLVNSLWDASSLSIHLIGSFSYVYYTNLGTLTHNMFEA